MAAAGTSPSHPAKVSPWASVITNGRTIPARIYSLISPVEQLTAAVSPLSMAVMAGPLPLYGTCLNSTSAAFSRVTALVCQPLPCPELAIVTDLGLAFAAATSSWIVLYGESTGTAMIPPEPAATKKCQFSDVGATLLAPKNIAVSEAPRTVYPSCAEVHTFCAAVPPFAPGILVLIILTPRSSSINGARNLHHASVPPPWLEKIYTLISLSG